MRWKISAHVDSLAANHYRFLVMKVWVYVILLLKDLAAQLMMEKYSKMTYLEVLARILW